MKEIKINPSDKFLVQKKVLNSQIKVLNSIIDSSLKKLESRLNQVSKKYKKIYGDSGGYAWDHGRENAKVTLIVLVKVRQQYLKFIQVAERIRKMPDGENVPGLKPRLDQAKRRYVSLGKAIKEEIRKTKYTQNMFKRDMKKNER